MSTFEITRMIGENLGEGSFLYWAYKNNIPVIVPGIMDGAVGSQIWLFTQKHHDFKLNLTADADLLSGLIFKAKKSGALPLALFREQQLAVELEQIGATNLALLYATEALSTVEDLLQKDAEQKVKDEYNSTKLNLMDQIVRLHIAVKPDDKSNPTL